MEDAMNSTESESDIDESDRELWDLVEDSSIHNDNNYCLKCYHMFKRNPLVRGKRAHNDDVSSEKTISAGVECKISIGISACLSSHTRCIFRCLKSHKLRRIPKDSRVQAFRATGIFVPPDSRCCSSHILDDGRFGLADLETLSPQTDTCEMTGEDVAFHMNTLRKTKSSSLDNTIFDAISDDKLKQQTGLVRRDFLSVSTHLKLNIRTEKSLALGLYLSKLRHGYPNDHFSVIFDTPRRTIDRYMDKVRTGLKENFVPIHLGQGLARQDLVEDRSRVAKALLVDEAESSIFVWDATYVYIQKSANYLFQRSSYSLHKHRCLVKPMIAVTTRGRIIKVFGPYSAQDSDATILEAIMESEFFLELFKEGDVFIVDRGFERVLAKLAARRFKTMMPCFIDKDKKQLTTEQANQSRVTTKLRYVIECVNGVLKSEFRYFDHV
ncbi:hypothetical protein QAD02_002193 [Eretmocerus hayati]|uniref:Uncharacterized protein n=1 Tax=Eretmocerus hayati TaxID=131215 RepID=A0ACC2NII1_9HYME|nr:hypothetical protein QAD02_002193 [Eretmocerus hayati]